MLGLVECRPERVRSRKCLDHCKVHAAELPHLSRPFGLANSELKRTGYAHRLVLLR